MSLTETKPFLRGYLKLVPFFLIFTGCIAAFSAWTGNSALLLVPAIPLLVAVLGPRFLRDPLPIFCGFLVLVANFDFVKVLPGLSLDVLISTILLWSLALRRGLEGHRFGSSPVEKALILLLLVYAATIVTSAYPEISIRRWVRELQYVVMYVFILHRPLSERTEKWIVRSCLAAVVLPCLAGFLGITFGIDAFFGADMQSTLQEDSFSRIRGTLAHPVSLAIYVGFFGTLLGSLMQGRQYAPRPVIAGLFLISMVTLYLTYGRSGWFGFAAAFAALLWIQGRKMLLTIGAPIAIGILFFALPVLQERVVSSASTENDNSFFWRLRLWAYALESFPLRPILGSGLGTFAPYIKFGYGFGPHSTWIGTLIESGWIGLTALLALMGTIWVKLWQRYRLYRPRTDLLLEGLIGGFLTLLISSIAASTWSLPSIVVYFWVLLAVVLHPDRLARMDERVKVRDLPEQSSRGSEIP